MKLKFSEFSCLIDTSKWFQENPRGDPWEVLKILVHFKWNPLIIY